MGLETTQMNANVPHDVGSPCQVPISLANIPLASSIGAGGNVVSGLLLTCGYKYFTFALTSSQNGSVSIQRYADQAGLIPVSTAITGTLVGGTATDVHSVDNIPYQSMVITVSNSGGSTATLSNGLLLLQAG